MNNFNWKCYINKYPDLINFGINTKEKAILHWKKYGKKEGRNYLPEPESIKFEPIVIKQETIIVKLNQKFVCIYQTLTII